MPRPAFFRLSSPTSSSPYRPLSHVTLSPSAITSFVLSHALTSACHTSHPALLLHRCRCLHSLCVAGKSSPRAPPPPSPPTCDLTHSPSKSIPSSSSSHPHPHPILIPSSSPPSPGTAPPPHSPSSFLFGPSSHPSPPQPPLPSLSFSSPSSAPCHSLLTPVPPTHYL
ncbi:hypothetical protein SERLA73DRAFT_80301 [Serpula lacrymans var. lacrymans S7.3]|uniref:Uncharacterized protein n=1 Tax=Serpula lacrymans var. lacrymans (strain S7.3) TaxID=936435 RepID=F8QJC0_SERL3|nr:hypothetical protein SERLA73DRAFT_80301 [Serpula lacrymans var. lacrymans S7.3]